MAEPSKPKKTTLSNLGAKVDQLIASIPQVGTGTAPKLHGPAEEFYARGGQAIPDFEPFIAGDEWNPQGLSPAEKVRIQQIMIRVGLLSPTDYAPAVWDDRSARAFSSVLGLANSKGMTNYEDALSEYARIADTYGVAPKQARQALTVQYENPEAIRQVVRKSSLSLLGRRLPDQEEAALISAYQSQYTGAQQAQYAAGGEAGGAYTAPLSMEEFATSRLEGRPEAGAQRYLDAFSEITKSLGVMAARPEEIGGR